MYLYSRAQSVMGGTSQIQRNLVATPNPGAAERMMTYDLPAEIQVEADGPIRVIRLNRPDQLNATNHVPAPGPGRAVPAARRRRRTPGPSCSPATVGRSRPAATSSYLDELTRDADLRQPRRSSTAARSSPAWSPAACPIVAAVNGPAVGLGCSLVALSDIVYMAESAHLADPHVLIGLVAADGGPVTWPLLTSLQLAKEYALTGDRIPGRAGRRDRPRQPRVRRRRGVRRGDGVRPRGSPRCPGAAVRGHQADPQPAPRAGRARHARLRPRRAEDRSFTSPELRANLDRFLSPKD